MEKNPEYNLQENLLKSDILGKILFSSSMIRERVSGAWK